MQPSDILPPTVRDGPGHSGAYGLYTRCAAWMLRRAVAYLSGDGNSFDMRVDIATPSLGEGRISVSVCLPPPTNRQTEPKPCVLVFEGGGFILGEPNDGQDLCRTLSDRLGAILISLNYAKAPQYPFPHALLQSFQVLKWTLSEEARKTLGMNIDHSRIATLGKSAGGNLAASLALLVSFDSGPCASYRRQLGPKFRHVAQISLYPSTACNVPYRERLARADADTKEKSLPVWAAEFMEACYLPPIAQTNQIFVAPSLAEVSLIRACAKNLPRFGFFLAGRDCLKLEANSFAETLREGGIDVVVHEYPAAIHGFIQYKAGAKEYREDDIKDCQEKMYNLLASQFALNISP